MSDRPGLCDSPVGLWAAEYGSDLIPRETNLEGLLGEDHPTADELKAMSIRAAGDEGYFAELYLLDYGGPDGELKYRWRHGVTYDALKRAGVPAELHIFELGPHGTGLGLNLKGLPELAVYPMLVENWMQVHGWMAVPKATE